MSGGGGVERTKKSKDPFDSDSDDDFMSSPKKKKVRRGPLPWSIVTLHSTATVGVLATSVA